MPLTDNDRDRIDEMTLHDMEFIYATMTPMSWPFNDRDAGDYFLDKFMQMGGNPDD